jgi:predicted RNA-binding Zn-ribbon protein involved in translation (DUF1610 family)
MLIESYTSKAGEKRFRPVIQSRSEMDDAGLCIACGVEASNVEPDARQYVCETCGENKVYGLEELVVMGIAKVRFGSDGEEV